MKTLFGPFRNHLSGFMSMVCNVVTLFRPFRNHLSNFMAMVCNVIIAFMIVLQPSLQTKFKPAGHLELTNLLCAQLMSWTTRVMNTSSILTEKHTQRENTHVHITTLTKSDKKKKKAYWWKMDPILFSCILLNTICLLGSIANRPIASRLSKYYCYTCEDINLLKHRRR